MYYWSGCETNFHQPETWDKIAEQIIWCNSLVRVGHRPIPPIGALVDNGCVFVRDLINENGEIYDYEHFKLECGNVDWLTYYIILNAVPKRWLKRLISLDITESDTNESARLTLDNIMGRKKPTSYIYNALLVSNYDKKFLEILLSRWQKNVIDTDLDVYKTLFKKLYLITPSTKLRDFYYRMLIGKIYTNTTLHRWKIVTDDVCNLCSQNVKQTIFHVFIECCNARKIWLWLKNICEDNVMFQPENIFTLSIGETKSVINFLALVAL